MVTIGALPLPSFEDNEVDINNPCILLFGNTITIVSGNYRYNQIVQVFPTFIRRIGSLPFTFTHAGECYADDGQAWFCFDFLAPTKCRRTYDFIGFNESSTTYSHRYGKLGRFKNNTVAIMGSNEGGYLTVEEHTVNYLKGHNHSENVTYYNYGHILRFLKTYLICVCYN